MFPGHENRERLLFLLQKFEQYTEYYQVKSILNVALGQEKQKILLMQ